MLSTLSDVTKRRLLLPVGLAVALVGVGGSYAVGAFNPAELTRVLARTAKTTPSVTEATEFSYGSIRHNRPVSADSALDHSLSLPGMKGVVRGVVGSPTSRQITVAGRPTVVTDYPFAIRGYLGRSRGPYSVGTTITLRVPGGTSGGVRTIVADAPRITEGSDLFVFVRDQGKIAGGSTDRILVASSPYDVLEVRSGVVRGQRRWSGLAEPVQTFERHFRR